MKDRKQVQERKEPQSYLEALKLKNEFTGETKGMQLGNLSLPFEIWG